MKKQLNKISLVTSCFNHEMYIEETIESILSQNYPKLEYVVIDDGSTDQSWKKIMKYQKHLHWCEKLDGFRKTPATALNYGFSKTSGAIMGWLNSDDILLRRSLFTVSDVFSDLQQVDWVTGLASTINTDSLTVSTRNYFVNKYDYLMGDWRIIQQESTFWRRNLWDKAGGYIVEFDTFGSFDTELWTRFFEHTEHFHLLAPIGAFRKGQQSRSTKDPNPYLESTKMVLKNMKSKASLGDLTKTQIQHFLKKTHLRMIIPDVSLLKNYKYKAIEYSFKASKWKINFI